MVISDNEPDDEPETKRRKEDTDDDEVKFIFFLFIIIFTLRLPLSPTAPTAKLTPTLNRFSPSYNCYTSDYFTVHQTHTNLPYTKQLVTAINLE